MGKGLIGVLSIAGATVLTGAAWGPYGDCDDCGNCPADLNGDSLVGVLDLLILFSNWGS